MHTYIYVYHMYHIYKTMFIISFHIKYCFYRIISYVISYIMEYTSHLITCNHITYNGIYRIIYIYHIISHHT